MIADNSFFRTKIFVFTGLGIGITATAISTYYYVLQKWKKLHTPPTKWKLVGKLDEIIYFPIKSCDGIQLNSANCDIWGIVDGQFKDRQFMLVNENDKLISANIYPKIIKIKPKIIHDHLYVTAPDMETLKIDFKNFTINGRNDIKAELWENPVYVTECGDQYNKWFSKFILGKDTGLRLVYYPYPVTTIDTINLFSYMMLNIDSINDLNTKLINKVNHLNFRGNFIVKTTNDEAYAEDNWKWIKIGNDVIFRKVQPCYRCIRPNVNPFTAERSKDFEPLKTLQKYRLFGDNGPELGIQMGILKTGVVKKDDNIYVGIEDI